MKHTLRHCQRILGHHTIAAYFFNARGDAFEKTPLGMLRSLVFQLIDGEHGTYDRLVPIFRKKNEMHENPWEWREPELKDFLLSEIQQPQHRPEPLVLLVDALDECSEAHVRDVVAFLEQLSVTASSGTGAALSICLSSRYYPHISMKRYQELVVEARGEHNGDIATYVRDTLTRRDVEIEEGVLRKASGIFMWVVLVVAMLNIAYDEGKVEAMQQKLREVPSDLDKLFWTILSRDNTDKHETVLMLQWVLFAKRPLKPEELYYATLGGTSIGSLGAWDSARITSDDIRRRIINSSRGLIEVRKGWEGAVQFIHESVNDFLLRNRRLQSLDVALEMNPIGISHDRLKTCCMSYMMMDAMPVPREELEAQNLGFRYPFLEYASNHFLDHAEAADAGHVKQTEFLRWLREEYGVWNRVRLFHNAFEPFGGMGCVNRSTLLYMLAVHGHPNLVTTLLESWADANLQGGFYGTALQAAAAMGHEATVRTILESGADVNAFGGRYGTALQAAAANDHAAVVTTLLQHDANVNTRGGYYDTALQAAATKGCDKTVVILLENGAGLLGAESKLGDRISRRAAARVCERTAAAPTGLGQRSRDSGGKTSSRQGRRPPRAAGRKARQGITGDRSLRPRDGQGRYRPP